MDREELLLIVFFTCTKAHNGSREGPKVHGYGSREAPKGWKQKESKKPICHLKALRGRREKHVPKPTLLDKALLMIQEGGAEVNLIQLGNEASMDAKLASLITYVPGHPHVVRVELQASEIFRLLILSR